MRGTVRYKRKYIACFPLFPSKRRSYYTVFSAAVSSGANLTLISTMSWIAFVGVLAIAQVTVSYPFSMFNNKRFTDARYQPAYIPVPIPFTYQQDYENSQDNFNPMGAYYYYPFRTDRRLGYLDEPTNEVESELNEQGYPFGQEMWYEGNRDNSAARAAANAEADAAFLRNLIITQMYQDAAASAAVSNPNRYSYPYMDATTDELDDKKWLYGVPTTGVDEKEKAREYLRNGDDEEVKELQSLRKQEGKEGKRRRKQKAKEQREKKSSAVVEVVSTSSPVVVEETKGRKNKPSGQKEFVLPQPPRPVRQPFAELSNRLHIRSEEPSVYQTIKQLLALEKNSDKTDTSRIKKRFVATEEQLAAQLSSLKKMSA